MIERIHRGWGIVRASWSVLRQHPKLLVLPILSGVATTGRAPSAFDPALLQRAFRSKKA